MNEKKHYVLSAFIISLGLLVSSFVVVQGALKFRDFGKFVEVKGLEERTVKSNLASWQISFSTTASDMVKLYQSVSESQAQVLNFLKNEGFEDPEIERQAVSVFDNYADPYVQRQKDVPRFKATTGFSIVSKKVDLVARANQKTEQLIQRGIIINNNFVRNVFTDLNSIKSDMLDKATANAREAGLSFAKNAQTSLGSIRHATQGVFTISAAGANGEYDDSSIMKKVRVVTSVQFFLD